MKAQATLGGTSLLRCGLPGSPGQLSDVNQTVESHQPLPAHQQLSSGFELRRKVRHGQPALWRRRLRCANPRHRGAHTYLGDAAGHNPANRENWRRSTQPIRYARNRTVLAAAITKSLLGLGKRAQLNRIPSASCEMTVWTFPAILRRDRRWAHFKITEPQVFDLKIPSNVRDRFHRINPAF